MITTGDSQDEGGHTQLEQLRHKARKEIGAVVDRCYELYSWILKLDVYVEENGTLGVKRFEGLTEFMEDVGSKLDCLVER
jgi:hypothetical protein